MHPLEEGVHPLDMGVASTGCGVHPLDVGGGGCASTGGGASGGGDIQAGVHPGCIPPLWTDRCL